MHPTSSQVQNAGILEVFARRSGELFARRPEEVGEAAVVVGDEDRPGHAREP